MGGRPMTSGKNFKDKVFRLMMDLNACINGLIIQIGSSRLPILNFLSFLPK